jgi:hypothetical protein
MMDEYMWSIGEMLLSGENRIEVLGLIRPLDERIMQR